MSLTNVLKLFRQARIGAKKLEFQQRRTTFKYYKPEPQENIDGWAKAEQAFRRVTRERVLAPKYRLRPFSERYHVTETFDFLKEPGPWRIMAAGVFLAAAFYGLFRDRKDMEELLVNFYHPETDTEFRFRPFKEDNLMQHYFHLDEQEGKPYRA